MNHDIRPAGAHRHLTPAQKKRLRRKRRIRKTVDTCIVVLVIAAIIAAVLWIFLSDPQTLVGKRGGKSGVDSNQTGVGYQIVVEPTRINVAASTNHSAWLADGRVHVAGDAEYSEESVAGWQDIIQISISDSHLVALDKYGRVLAAGRNASGQCRVHGLEKAAFVAAGPECTVCVMRDGTVDVYGIMDGAIRRGLESAAGVSMVDIGADHVVVRHIDGSVSAYGENANGECDVTGWSDVVWVSAGDGFTVALTSEGKALFAGSNGYCQRLCTKWDELAYIEAGRTYVVAARRDGTMLAVGRNGMGQCELDDWRDVVSVAAGYDHTIGMRSDGSVIAAGYNGDGQCDLTLPAATEEPSATETPFEFGISEDGGDAE